MIEAFLEQKIELKKADARTLKEAQKLADKISKIVLIAGSIIAVIIIFGRIV